MTGGLQDDFANRLHMSAFNGRGPLPALMLGVGKVRLVLLLTAVSILFSNAVAYLVCRSLFPDMAFGPAWYLTATVVPLFAASTSFWIILSLLWTIEEQNRALGALLHRDDLTATYNRRHFDGEIRRRAAELQGRGSCFSLIILDVDFFKHVNDRYGHAGGDAALIEIARRAKDTVRPEDVVTRFGGEEFVIFLPEADHATALVIAEGVRAAIDGEPITHGGSRFAVTVSLGLACSQEAVPTAALEDILKLADTRLYRAKQMGRNRVIAAAAG